MKLINRCDLIKIFYTHEAELGIRPNSKAQPVCVPSNCGKDAYLAYRYGNLIRIGFGTDFTPRLQAIVNSAWRDL